LPAKYSWDVGFVPAGDIDVALNIRLGLPEMTRFGGFVRSLGLC